jgi:hypothetical protein
MMSEETRLGRIRECRGTSVAGLLMGLVLLLVGAFAISLPILNALDPWMAQRRAGDVARLAVIASAARLDEARDGDEVLLEGRISRANTFTALRTWRSQGGQYVLHDGKFAASWTQHVRPTENGVTFDAQISRWVPAGLRVQVAPDGEVAIENTDFKTNWEGGYSGAIYGRDLPPLIDLVLGVELGQPVTVQGRLHHSGARWTIRADYLFDTTALDHVRSLNQRASEAGALARGFSDVLWAVCFVVGVPCVIGGIIVLRRSSKNR